MVIPKLALSPESIGFWGTIVVTCIETFGLWKQNAKIWSHKSGKSLSVVSIAYLNVLYCVTFAYGFSKPDVALMFNGGLVVLCIPMIIGLSKFKGFTRSEKFVSCFFALFLIVDLLLPLKDWGFLIYSFGSFIPLSMLPIEMWKAKSSGVVEIRLILVYLLSSIFWVIYGFAIHDWALQIICPIHVGILAVAIIVWLRFRDQKEEHRATAS